MSGRSLKNVCREKGILQKNFRAVVLFGRLKAFVASISKIASQFFSNSLRRAWIACSIPAVYPRQS